jgi:hypothetical protein
MRFLKWREEKRRGGGRRDHRQPKPVTFEEAVDNVMRKIEAIDRHEKRKAALEGDSAQPGEE